MYTTVSDNSIYLYALFFQAKLAHKLYIRINFLYVMLIFIMYVYFNNYYFLDIKKPQEYNK